MTLERIEIYENTVKRLARGGIKDPTNQIIYLAQEIEGYRLKIRGLEGEIEEIAPYNRPCKHELQEHERIFFALCYNMRFTYKPRDVVNILADTIPHKRCWYYLDKWARLGFYDYGVTADLGWFELDKIPQRYLDIIKED